LPTTKILLNQTFKQIFGLVLLIEPLITAGAAQLPDLYFLMVEFLNLK
jgi:hypothetical protein